MGGKLTNMSEEVKDTESGRIGNDFFSAICYCTFLGFLNHAVGFYKSVILARLLLLQYFGVFGIALSISFGLAVFSEFGLKARFISFSVKDAAE